jgi:hypothetical protein
MGRLSLGLHGLAGFTQAVSSVYIVGVLYVLLRLQAHIASRYICLNWTLKERVKKGAIQLSQEARPCTACDMQHIPCSGQHATCTQRIMCGIL